MSSFNYHEWLEENVISKFSPPQLSEFRLVIESQENANYGQIAMDIRNYGSLEGARRHYDREQQRQLKAAATMARNQAEGKTSKRVIPSAPGYVYIYRFRHDGDWLYKFRLIPAKTNRLELFRCVWVDSGARSFVKSYSRASWRAGNSYSLPTRAVMELVDMPTGRPATDTPQVVIEYATVRPRFSSSTAGFVYVLKSPTGAYKVGRTVNPDDRLRTFNVKLPFPVEYDCLIKTDDMYKLEGKLHYKFAGQRIDGEWFNLTARDLEFLRRLATLGGNDE